MKKTKQEREAAWQADQLDPDNWLEIPDFGVLPADVQFAGFAFPIVDPSPRFYEARLEIREMVRSARDIARTHFSTIGELLETELAGWDAYAAGQEVSDRMGVAMLYRTFMGEIQEALTGNAGREARARDLASAALTLCRLVEVDAHDSDRSAADTTSQLLARVRGGGSGQR